VYWRAAGLSYNRYLNVASKALRNMVKQSVRDKKKYFLRDRTGLTMRNWSNGKKGEVPETIGPIDEVTK